MARINKSELTKTEIVGVASDLFLKKGYSNTSVKAISDKLDMSTGNLTFYFPTKENLLAELVDIMCDFQWQVMKKEADEGTSSILALCLELTAMASMCEQNEIAKDFYISAYSSPLALDIIRRNDVKRAKDVFAKYCSDWTDEQFAEAEILVSGIEYATLMTTGDSVSLETRIAGAINNILSIYRVPEEIRKIKISKVFNIDYHGVGHRVFEDFKKYVEEANEKAFIALLKS